MKKESMLIIFFILLVATNFAQNTGNNYPKQNLKEDCIDYVDFGDTKICIPEMEGMIECFNDRYVIQMLSNLTYEDNIIMAIYLPKETYNNIKNIEGTFENYISIYANKLVMDIYAAPEHLNLLADQMSQNFVVKRWENMKANNETVKSNLSLGKPVLIDNYSLTDSGRSFVILSKINNQITNSDEVKIIILNVLIIKDRMIWVGYYKNYTGVESVEKAKSINDYFIYQLFAENN